MGDRWEVLVTALQVGAVLLVVVLPRAVCARSQYHRLRSLMLPQSDETR